MKTDIENTKDSAGADSSPSPCSAINIVFDGPPGPEAGRFVEVETDDGKSINAGEWIKRPDGYWALRIASLPNVPHHLPRKAGGFDADTKGLHEVAPRFASKVPACRG